jgi:hypothetical protein
MQIVLNSKLEKIEGLPKNNSIKYLVGQIQRRLGENYKPVGSYLSAETVKQLGFVGVLSRAYSLHEKLEIAPHDIWYLILSEIALIIKGNEQVCRPLFTRDPENKIDISVPVDDVTQINLRAIIAHLRVLVPVDIDIFIPKLSNITPEAQTSLYAALADGVSGYYSYSTFCCGLPEIRLTGTQEDWITLYNSARSINGLFTSVNFREAAEYMDKVSQTLHSIVASFDKQDLDFWKNIFTQENIGSGGELEINGWITSLYWDLTSPRKLENFMVNNTVVPYKNLETGRKFKGVFGAFETFRTEDDFLRTGYSQIVFEELSL